ncbi:MFS transporter [Arthrobacter sp. TMN-49]
MKNPIFTRSGIGTCFGGMLLIGGLEALYGPSLIRLIVRFDTSPAMAGLIVSAHFAAGLLGVLISQWSHSRIGNRVLLSAGYLLLIAGSLAFAWAPSLTLAVTASAIAGLGFGALDYAFSHLFAVAFSPHSGRMLNLLHGFFGVGAIVAPLAVVLLGPENYPAYFTAFAALALVTTLGLRGIRSHPTQGATTNPGTEPVPRPAVAAIHPRTPMFAAAFAAMIAVFVLHVAVGSGIGTWEAAYLNLRGHIIDQAAVATSLFWFSMTISRFVLAAVIKRLQPGTVVTLSCLLMTTGALTALVPGAAVLGFTMVGFAIGPVFPTALAWATQIYGGRSWTSGFLIAISMVGGIIFPPALGFTVTIDAAPGLFPIGLSVLSILCVAACVSLTWMRRKSVRMNAHLALTQR